MLYGRWAIASPVIILLFFFSLGTPKSANASILTIPSSNQKGFSLEGPEKTFTVPSSTLISWQGQYFFSEPLSDFSNSSAVKKMVSGQYYKLFPETPKYFSYNFDPQQIYQWVKNLTPDIEQLATEPKLTIVNERATEFQPSEPGQALDIYSSTKAVLLALSQNVASAQLAVDQTATVTPLSKTNDLGINELIARGQSNYRNSPKNRIHNIKVGVSKMVGVIIPPGEEFSFNKYLGPVEANEGFLPELVIKAEGTVPELGGGLCQVSTTTFRAAMIAGLPINARRNHSYAVSYYGPQGTDATIYPGVQDLKFTNDTPGSILIWPHIDEATHDVFFDFYGTKDERKVTLETPVQFDRKPDGSLKASWTRIVTKNGVSETKTFNSNYQPPALFHKQEQFVPASPNTPTEQPQNPAPNTPPPAQVPPTNSTQL